MSFKRTLEIRLFGLVKIPLIAYVRPTLVELNEKSCVIKIPLIRRNKNHLNSMYFGVLATGADLTCGYLAMDAIKRTNAKVNMVFKSFQADFHEKVTGDAYFRCDQGEIIAAGVEKARASGERVDVPVSVIASIGKNSSEPAATFQLVLSLRSKKASK